MVFRRRKRDLEADIQSTLDNLHRLESLQHSGLMDAPARDDLTDIVENAAKSMGSEMSTLTMVDNKRQFFAAETGREGGRETDLDRSYCKYVVAGNDVFAIEDASTDSLVMNNPAFLEDGLRSYLGVPIRRNGEVIGALCVMNKHDRQWTDEELAKLESLADEAMKRIGSPDQVGG